MKKNSYPIQLAFEIVGYSIYIFEREVHRTSASMICVKSFAIVSYYIVVSTYKNVTETRFSKAINIDIRNEPNR